MSNARIALFASVAFAAGFAAGDVQAQTGAAAAPAAENAPAEVIVTAQKRTQNLQDVPVVVTVLNAVQLQDAGVRDIKDLTILTPGLTVTSTGSEGSTTARIRGVGTVSDNVGLEDSVGVYIDGVYRPRNGVAFNDLGEMSDIEVLKGPQGTLFGKNTTAGVIQISTKRPSFVFGAQGEATVSNFGGYGGSVSVTGPIIPDKIAGRLYLADRQRDGFIAVTQAPGAGIPKQNDEHLFTVRGQALVDFTPTFDVNFIGDYTKRNDHCCVALAYANSSAPTSPASLLNLVVPGSTQVPANAGAFRANLNHSDVENITDQGLSAEANWKTPWLNNATLTSITAARSWRDSGGGDADASGADLLVTTANSYTQFTQYSEELRYHGSTDRLDWMVGGFFSRELLDHAVGTVAGTDLGAWQDFLIGALYGPAYGALLPHIVPGLSPANFPAGSGAFDVYHQVEHSESVFTQETFKITDALELTGGLRYTAENKVLNSVSKTLLDPGTCSTAIANATFFGVPANKSTLGLFCAIVPGFNGFTNHQAITEDAVTGTVKLAYRFSPQVMAYANYSRGNLAGGFNQAEVTTAAPGLGPNSSFTPDPSTSFNPEFVDAYEIGEKSTLFDRRVLLDAAIFYQKYHNFQLNTFTGTEFIVTNIPDVVSQGAEFEMNWFVDRGFNVNLGATYADTYYVNSNANVAALAGTPLTHNPGQRLSLAPLWSVAGGVSYAHDLTDTLRWRVAVDAKWMSTMITGSDLDPAKTQPAFALVNARLGLSGPKDRWTVEAWSNNLFNQFYQQVAYDGAYQSFAPGPGNGGTAANAYYAFPGMPRTYGLTLRYKY